MDASHFCCNAVVLSLCIQSPCHHAVMHSCIHTVIPSCLHTLMPQHPRTVMPSSHPHASIPSLHRTIICHAVILWKLCSLCGQVASWPPYYTAHLPTVTIYVSSCSSSSGRGGRERGQGMEGREGGRWRDDGKDLKAKEQ